MTWVSPRTYSSGEVLTAAHLNEYSTDLTVLSTALLIPNHNAGDWYCAEGSVDTNNVITLNTLYAASLTIPATKTYDRIGIYVTSTAVGNIRLGIYNDNAGLPGALLLDAGTVTTNGAGQQSITISQAISGPTKVWLAGVCSATFNAYRLNISSLGLLGTGSTGGSPGWARAFTYAALPDPWGTPTTPQIQPLIAIRAV